MDYVISKVTTVIKLHHVNKCLNLHVLKKESKNHAIGINNKKFVNKYHHVLIFKIKIVVNII